MFDKKTMARKALGMLEKLASNKPLHKQLEDDIANTVAKDESISFLIKAFANRYGINVGMVDIIPIVTPRTLTIESWALKVDDAVIDKKPTFTALIEQINAAIIGKDQELDDALGKINVAL